MTAKRFAIIEAIEAGFLTLPDVEEVQINAAGDPSRFPALFIDDAGHTADSSTEPGATRYALQLSVEGYVEGGDGKEATAQINVLYLSVVDSLMTNEALALLVEELNEGNMRMATAVLAKARRMGFSLDVEITFAADRNYPAAD